VIQPRLPPRQPHPHVAVHDRPAVVLVRPLRAAIPGGKRTQVSRAGTLRFVVRLLSSCGSLDAWSF
jgi:hypothetical protein